MPLLWDQTKLSPPDGFIDAPMVPPLIQSVWKVLDFFEGDRVKTELWFASPNPMLGGLSALQLLELRGPEHLLKVIHNLIHEGTY